MELTLKEFHVYYKEKNHEKKDNIQLWEINQAISEQYMSAKKLYVSAQCSKLLSTIIQYVYQ